MEKKLEAAEMWYLRRMMRIHRPAKITIEEVLRRAGTQRMIMKTIRKRQLEFIVHFRRTGRVEKDCL